MLHDTPTTIAHRLPPNITVGGAGQGGLSASDLVEIVILGLVCVVVGVMFLRSAHWSWRRR